jgi:Cof subfamily protein (haloacid dehalogenase superfamily)
MNTTYALIALDVDGTLLRSDKTLHPDTRTDIEYAVSRGVEVAFCTGRPVAELAPYMAELPMMRYAVCTSGALVYDTLERRRLYERGVGRETAAEIVQVAARLGGMPHLMTERASIVAASDLSHMADFHMGVFQPLYEVIATRVEDMLAETQRHDSFEKINIYFRAPEHRAQAYEALKHLPLQFALAETTSLEMTAQGVNKGSGLRKLAEYLGIPMTQTVGIGDSDNDRDMLAAVGLSVAMGNALKDIQCACDQVTQDNEHNGVGQAIRRIVE